MELPFAQTNVQVKYDPETNERILEFFRPDGDLYLPQCEIEESDLQTIVEGLHYHLQKNKSTIRTVYCYFILNGSDKHVRLGYSDKDFPDLDAEYVGKLYSAGIDPEIVANTLVIKFLGTDTKFASDPLCFYE